MKPTCPNCNLIYKKLEQHEETIAQLVAIIASTNRKVNELDYIQDLFKNHIQNHSSSLRLK